MPSGKEVELSYIVDCQSVKNTDKSPLIGYSILTDKSRDVLAQVISDRVSFLKGTIDELAALIKERQELKVDQQSNIDNNLCQIQSAIYALEQDIGGGIDKSERRIWMEKHVAELYRERRQHELFQWRDIVKLKHEKRKAEKELRSAMLDLWMIQFLS